ncbi:23465_t:CDS:2 [Dentiscutata erythropus]|uniref:23465_t:CDS:1 n=1 Tax=Dentiscutata erythropus TaxID=1348616 RepID=A0A9N9CU13_9GLOM|nr:23465_t:CDS:2 [Dentiscutata erythropus]
MPCYADTIVKIYYVKQNVSSKDPIYERDSETQAVFVKDNFFCVGGKIVPGFFEGKKRAKMTVSTSTHVTILNKAVSSNKCPLKVSLVGIPQEMPNEVNDDVIISTLVTDYAGQEYNFFLKVVFSRYVSQFSYLKSNMHPQESLIFVVSQLEIINNELYVYARDINYVDTQFNNKKNVIFDRGVPQVSSASKNSVRSRLLVTHRNVADKPKFNSDHNVESSVSSGDYVGEGDSNLVNNFRSLRCARVEEYDDSVEDFNNDGSEVCNDFGENFEGKFKKEVSVSSGDHVDINGSSSSYSSKRVRVEDSGESIGRSCMGDCDDLFVSDRDGEVISSDKKGKGHADRVLRSSFRLHSFDSDSINYKE